MEAVISEFINVLLASQITTKIVVLLCAGVLVYLQKKFNEEKSQMLQDIRKEIQLLSHKITATDYALEQSFQNGYKGYRQDKFQQLIQDDEYLKSQKH